MPAATAKKSSPFLRIIEFADELQISEKTVRNRINNGEIHAVRLGKRIVRIPRTEIERLRRGEPVSTAFRSAQASDIENTTT